MHIVIQIDETAFPMERDIQRRLVCQIYWKYEGTYYPEKHWVDRGYIILGWWVSTLMRLSCGESGGNFAFMDGPYSIAVEKTNIEGVLELRPQGNGVVWNVTWTELVQELIQVTEFIHQKLMQQKVSNEEMATLEKYSEALKKIV